MYQKTKKLFLGLLLALFSGAVMADENVQYVMYVNLVDGTKDEYIVADHPYVKFDKDNVYVWSDKVDAKYATADVADYTFAQYDETAIEDVKIDETVVQLSVKFVDGSNVIIRGMQSKGDIRVYSVDGTLQNAEISRIDDGANISLANLPKGTYLIKIGKEKTVKVFKK